MPRLSFPRARAGRGARGLWSAWRGRVRLVPVLGIALGSVLSGVLGCGSEVVGTKPTPDVSLLYWTLTLDQHAITLDSQPPYDTVRLHATPRTISGDSLGGLAQVTYVSTDLERVRVSADGLLQAVKATNGTPVQVIATLTVGKYTHADTALVNVTALGAPPAPLVTFSIHPTLPDSARWAVEGAPFGSTTTTVTLHALDGAAVPLPAFVVAYRSSDSTIATIDPTTGEVTGRRPGAVRLIASATLYGVAKADTLPFTITGPLQVSIDLVHPFLGAASWVFSPSDVTLEAGGIILWGISNNYLIESTDVRPPVVLDVVFADPTQVGADPIFCGQFLVLLGASCEAGDIPAFGDTARDQFTHYLKSLRTRQFLVPGTYPFHSALLNSAGTVRVIRTP